MSIVAVHLSPTHSFSKYSQPSITLLKGLGVEGDCHLGKLTQHEWRWKDHANDPNRRQVHLIQSELFAEADFHGDDGVRVQPGQMGENITTTGIDLLKLSEGTKLRFVEKSELENQTVDALLRVFIQVTFIAVIAIGVLAHADNVYTAIAVVVHFAVIILRALVWYTNRFHGDYPDAAVVTLTGLRTPCRKVDAFRKGLKQKCFVRDENNKPIDKKAGVMGIVEGGGVVRPGMMIVVEMPKVFVKMKAVES